MGLARIVFLFAFIFLGCSKTKNVDGPPLGLPEIPTELPDGEIPPIQNGNDGIVQNDEIEDAAMRLAFTLQAQSETTVRNTRFVSLVNFANAGQDLAFPRSGIDLGLNLLSNRRFLERVEPVQGVPGLYSYDLRDFFGSRGIEIYKKLEEQAVIKVVSETSRNRNLQFLTGSRIPIMHAQILLETAFQAASYYDIKGVPQSEDQFWLNQGIDRQRDFDDRDDEIFMAGFEDSLIAPQHNRAIRRMRGNNGPCYNTYDVDAANIQERNNFGRFPLPLEARGDFTFRYAAGEILCIQPNGLFTAALYNEAGQLQLEAPTTVVVNTRAAGLGLDPSITLRDCAGCHIKFVLPFTDVLGGQVEESRFDIDTKTVARRLYRPKVETDAFVNDDNAQFSLAQAAIGISNPIEDPLNVGIIDKLRDGATAQELADFLYITKEELINGIRSSQDASGEIGVLLQGDNARVGFFSLQAGIPVLIRDLGLFRDP